MFDSRSTIHSVSAQPITAIRNNKIATFPCEATITNVPRAVFTGKLNSVDNPIVPEGATVTVVSRKCYFHYNIVLSDGTQGVAFARDIEAK